MTIMDTVALLLLAIMPVLVITAGLTDMMTMKIPNWISGCLVVAYFPTSIVVGFSVEDIGLHVTVGLAALIVSAVMFALRWIGGGDAKLLAACGLWFGLSGFGMFLFWTAAMGGLLSLTLIIARSHLRPYLLGGPSWSVRLLEPRGDIPYGVAIAAGALIAYPASPLMTAFLTI